MLQVRGLEVTIVLADSLPMSLLDADTGERIDVLATAIWAGLTAEGFAGSDLSCAPPFSPVYDPVAVAARVAGRVERG